MSREDIYDHLAQVYLGKRKDATDKKKKQFSVWIVINVLITGIIFASAFYGLSAFLTHNRQDIQNGIIYSLHQGTMKVEYRFGDDFPPTKTLRLNIPEVMDAGQYDRLKFSIRGKEEGTPGIVKIVFRNRRNEVSSYYVQGVGLKWQDVEIALDEFYQITDWSSLEEVSFVLESWNVDHAKGVVLIDNICFAGVHRT